MYYNVYNICIYKEIWINTIFTAIFKYCYKIALIRKYPVNNSDEFNYRH